MTGPSVKVSAEDAHLIAQIVMRAVHEGIIGGETAERITLALDIAAVHHNTCPLRLRELLAARSFDFGHDVGGLQKYLNRRDASLTDGFLPRFAVAKALA